MKELILENAQDLADWFAVDVAPIYDFGYMPSPYSEAAERSNLQGAIGMTHNQRKKENIDTNGEPLRVDKMFDDSFDDYILEESSESEFNMDTFLLTH